MKRLGLYDERFWDLLRRGLERLKTDAGGDSDLIEEAGKKLVSLETITRVVIEHFPELETLQGGEKKSGRRLPARRQGLLSG